MDSTGYVRRSENPGKKQCRIDGQDPSECRATPRIFPDPVPFRNGYGCVGLQDKGSISVAHVICGLHCIVCHQKRGGGKETRRVVKGYGRQRAEYQYRKKTIYLRFNGDGNLDGNSDINLQAGNTFKYLGATLANNGDLDAEMTHLQSGWKNWKRVSGILCDRRISLRVKG